MFIELSWMYSLVKILLFIFKHHSSYYIYLLEKLRRRELFFTKSQRVCDLWTLSLSRKQDFKTGVNRLIVSQVIIASITLWWFLIKINIYLNLSKIDKWGKKIKIFSLIAIAYLSHVFTRRISRTGTKTNIMRTEIQMGNVCKHLTPRTIFNVIIRGTFISSPLTFLILVVYWNLKRWKQIIWTLFIW